MKTVDITYRYGAQSKAARPRPLNSDAAHIRLNDGNQAFAALLEGMTDPDGRVQKIVFVDPSDLGLLAGDPALPKQRPFAVILGCSDARVPIELIFNQGPNDLFVIRVAGNGLGTEVLGSLKYAVDHLSGSLKLIVVLGHSGCGALTAAVDAYLNPTDYLSHTTKHSLRSILDGLLVVVQASAKKKSRSFRTRRFESSGISTGPHRGVDRHQFRACCLLIAARIRVQRSSGIASRIRRLPSRDPAGMGTECGQHEGNWIDRCAPRPGGIYRTWQRDIAVRPN